jgi:hypothetical protein
MGPPRVKLVRRQEIAAVFSALLFACSMWYYVQHVVIRHQIEDSHAHDIPRGNLSDLYPRWLGARELLLHHRDPYSVELTREIQAGYYGRALDPARPNDPKDQQAFAYPLYVVFLLAPTVTLPFPAVQIGFYWILIGATLMTVFLWLRILQWHTSPATAATLIVLTLGSFQVLQGLKLQQLTLLVSGLIAGSVALIVSGHLITAGILLALATIKPQLVLPLVVWLALWSLSDWQNRKNLAYAFCTTIVVLVTGSVLLLPQWITDFRTAIAAYRQYNAGALSILQVLTSPALGDVIAVLVLCWVGWMAWKNRGSAAGSTVFNWTTALVLVVTILAGPKTSPYNQILLLPGILFAAQHCRVAAKGSPARRTTFLLSALILFWPWIAAFTIVLYALTTSNVPTAWAAPIYTNLGIPFAVCVVLAFNLKDQYESAPTAKLASAS